MIKELNALIGLLKDTSGIKHAGLERGQFTNTSQNYPLPFPSALIDVGTIEFMELGAGEEDALIPFTVNLYLNGIEDTINDQSHTGLIEQINRSLKSVGCTRQSFQPITTGHSYIQYKLNYRVLSRIMPETTTEKIKPKVSIHYVLT